MSNKKDEKAASKSVFDKIKYNISKKGAVVKIPFVVVGEIMNNLITKGFTEKERKEILDNFFNLIKELSADLVPPKPICFVKAEALHLKDKYMVENAPTDCLIVLFALCDPYSTHLLMHDKIILETRTCRNIEEDMRENGERYARLNIIDGMDL